MSTATPVCSIRASVRCSGSSTPYSRLVPSRSLDLDVEGVGQVDHRAGPDHRRLGRHLGARVVVAEVERQLVGVGRARVAGLDLELTLQVADGEVGQVEGPLVGSGQVRGQLGVGGQPVQLPAARPDGQQRTLGVVHRLGSGRVGQPRGERLLVGGQQLGDVDVRRRPVRRGQRERARCRRCPSPSARSRPSRSARRSRARQPAASSPGSRISPTARSRPRADLLVRQRLQQPVPEHPELQPVEQLVGRLPVPRPALEVVDASGRSRSRIRALIWRFGAPRSIRSWNASAALPLSSPAWPTRFSSPSYVSSHFAAVFGPTPGHARAGCRWSPRPARPAPDNAPGVAKYFSSTAAGVIRARSETPLRG